MHPEESRSPQSARRIAGWLPAVGGACARDGGPGDVQVTATRRAESTFDVPVATDVIDRDEIRAAAPQTVMDALRGRAGAYVQQTTPGQGVVILRGLKGSEVLHVVDGFRLNDAIFRNAPNQYVALVDSQSLARIEVVRGPMSALYGSDAMGGVLQMLTWEPRFDGGEWQTRGLLRSMYGSADDSTLSRVEGALGRERLVVSGGATYQDVNERRVGGGEELPYTQFTASAADAKVRAMVTAATNSPSRRNTRSSRVPRGMTNSPRAMARPSRIPRCTGSSRNVVILRSCAGAEATRPAPGTAPKHRWASRCSRTAAAAAIGFEQ